MAFEDTDLSGLGREARARIVAGDKAKSRSEDMYKSAGLYLIEAKKRVRRVKGLTWPEWLRDNCPVGPRRADELISIADGRVTLEQFKDQHAERMRGSRERQKSTKTVDQASRDAETQLKPQQNQWKEVLNEVQDTTHAEREDLLREVSALIRSLTTVQLKQTQEFIQNVKQNVSDC